MTTATCPECEREIDLSSRENEWDHDSECVFLGIRTLYTDEQNLYTEAPTATEEVQQLRQRIDVLEHERAQLLKHLDTVRTAAEGILEGMGYFK